MLVQLKTHGNDAPNRPNTQLAGYISANVSQPFLSYGSYYGSDCSVCSVFRGKVSTQVIGKCLSCLRSRVAAFFAPKPADGN